MKTKVIIWGHKLEDGHTHSFIHNAFYKAFKYLGYEVNWLDNWDFVDTDECSNTIFLTEGQVDKDIPIRKDCKYILHNCDLTKYQDVIGNCLNMQVFTVDTLKPERNCSCVEEFVYYQDKKVIDDKQVGIDNRTLYMPWATHLLPNEIVTPAINTMKAQRSNNINWVGSICGGEMGNKIELEKMAEAAHKMGVQVVHTRVPEGPQSMLAILNSHSAPAIQGQWQVDKGYIPCRVFKNISFGRVPATNNKYVADLFQQRILFCKPEEMPLFGRQFEDNFTQKDLCDLVETVKNKHTYLNRIEVLLKVL